MRYLGKQHRAASIRTRLIQSGSAALLVLCASTPLQAQETNEGEGYAQRLRELLQVQGYSQIEFLDLNGNSFSAKACSESIAYTLTFNRNGRIMKKTSEGSCAPPNPEQQIADESILDTLYGRGYLRVNIVDRSPPTLMANACRGDRKFQVRMDADGEIIDSKEDGECNLAEGKPLTPSQIESILTRQGYRNIRIAEVEAAPYTAKACNGIRQFELEVSGAARITARKAKGFCQLGIENVEYLPPRPVEEARLEGTDALEPESCQMVLDWLQYETPLTFTKESSKLSEKDEALVATMAETIKRCPSTQILIEGHTSQSGEENFNQELSEKRALAVQKALLASEIAGSRLKARGFGEAYPRIDGDTDADLNRRIEIQLEWGPSQG